MVFDVYLIKCHPRTFLHSSTRYALYLTLLLRCIWSLRGYNLDFEPSRGKSGVKSRSHPERLDTISTKTHEPAPAILRFCSFESFGKEDSVGRKLGCRVREEYLTRRLLS
jgi:hypothetical protein